MYLNFFGLREEPFGVTPDPRFLYLSPSYREAEATLEYGIRSGRGFTAVVAQPGMGKTTLLFQLLERYSGVARTAFIFLTQCDSREFLRYMMSELGAETGENDFVRLQEQFGELLVREAHAGKKVIAVVDEAQNLDVSVLETVRLLSDFETTRAKLLHIILAGQPELAEKLASPALPQLRQRISHLVRLRPLRGAEVAHYIEHRLRVAGYSGPSPLFTHEAQAMILERSQGIPRLINNLCFNGLSLARALNKRIVDERVMAEVSADLDFVALTRAQEEPEAENEGLPPSSGMGDGEAEGQERRKTENATEESNGEAVAAAAADRGETAVPTSEVAAALGPVLVPSPQPRSPIAGQSEDFRRGDAGNHTLDGNPLEVLTAQAVPKPGNGVAAPYTVDEAMPGNSARNYTARAVPPQPRVVRLRGKRGNGALPKASKALWITPGGGRVAATAAVRGRHSAAATAKRQRQRDRYLAVIASVLLLIVVAWLLTTSGTSVPAQDPTHAAPAQTSVPAVPTH